MKATWTRVSCGVAIVAFWYASTAHAAFQSGVNPFGELSGTGASQTANVDGFSAPAFYDRYVRTAPFHGPLPTSPMGYEERWNTPQALNRVVIDSADRQVGGTIYVTHTAGGALDQLYGTFSNNVQEYTFVDGAGAATSNVYGVRVESNSTTSNYYQLGDLEFWNGPSKQNLALGATTISSPLPSRSGSVTDQSTMGGSSWRANETLSENYIGFQYGSGVTKTIDALRVESGSVDGATWTWRDFDVQVLQGGVWNTLGRVDFTASQYDNQSIFWASFDEVTVEGVRLYGSTAGGNNPIANNGKIVEDIAVFEVPEPAGAAIVAMAMAVIGGKRKQRGPACRR